MKTNKEPHALAALETLLAPSGQPDYEGLAALIWNYKLDDLKEDYYKDANNLIIACDVEGKKYKKYAIINKDDLKYLEYIDINAYEVILSHSADGDDDRIYKYHTDTDLIINEADKEKYFNILKAMSEDVFNKIKEKYPAKITGDIKDIIYLDASGYKNNGDFKFSYHTIYPIYTSNYSLHYCITAYIITHIIAKYNKDTKGSLIDTAIYTNNDNNSRLFRLPYQSKGNEILRRPLIPHASPASPASPINYLDYIITTFNNNIDSLTQRDIIDGGILGNLPKRAIKPRNITAQSSLLIDLHILKVSYNFKGYDDNQIYKIIKETYNNNEDILKAKTIIYLNNIVNTPDTRQDYMIWFKIVSNLKIIGSLSPFNDPDYFKDEGLEWTIRGYKKEYEAKQRARIAKNEIEIKEATDKFNIIWDNINTDFRTIAQQIQARFSINNLYNYALPTNKHIADKIQLQEAMFRMYDFDGKYKNDFREVVLKNKEELDLIPYINAQTIATSENVGRGKTNQVLKLIIKHIKETKGHYLLFSNRCIFGVDLKAKVNKALELEGLNPAYYYEDGNANSIILLDNYSGVICSVESLYKNYDIMKRLIRTKNYITFFDESETLLTSLYGKTKNKNEIGTLDLLIKIWGNASLNIVADAYATNKTMDFIANMNNKTGRTDATRNIYIHSSDYNPYPKTFNIMMASKKKNDKYEDIIKAMKIKICDAMAGSDNRICILCEKLDIITELRGVFYELSKDPKYNFNIEHNYIEHTGEQRANQTADEYAHSVRMFRTPELFKEIKVWIYNTTILNGVSVENVYFNNCYCIMENFGDSLGTIKANDMMNAIARARQSNEWNIYFYSNPSNNRENISLDLKILREQLDAAKIERIGRKITTTLSEYEDAIEIRNELANQIIKYKKDKNYYDSVITTYGRIKEYVFYKYDEDGNKRECFENIVLRIPYETYNEILETNLITRSKERAAIYEEVMLNSIYETNANLVYKKDIFIYLAQLKGNIIKDFTGDKIEAGDEEANNNKYDSIINAPNVATITADTGDNNIHYLNNYINQHIYETGRERLKILINICRKHRAIFKNWVNLKTNDRSDFNPIYIKNVIKIISDDDKATLENIPYQITTKDIRHNRYDIQIKTTAEEFYKSKRQKYEHNDKPINTIKAINDILYIVGFKYDVDKAKTIRETTGRRGYIYTYDLIPTIKKYEGSYKDTSGDNIEIKAGISDLFNSFIWGNESEAGCVEGEAGGEAGGEESEERPQVDINKYTPEQYAKFKEYAELQAKLRANFTSMGIKY